MSQSNLLALLLAGLFSLLCLPNGILEGYSYFYHHHHNRSYIRYTLVDLGPSGLSEDQLSRFSLPLTFAPQINNAGQVIFNDTKGGRLWDPCQGSSRLTFADRRAHFHALADNGNVLCSYCDDNGRMFWLIWPEKCGIHIDPVALEAWITESQRIYLRNMNEEGLFAGALLVPEGRNLKTYSVAVLPDGRVQKLCPGMPWGISKEGYIVANSGEEEDNRPYVWHPFSGGLILPDHECLKKPQGSVRYVDTVSAYDGSIYGSYFYTSDPDKLFNYHWEPCQDKFKTLDFQGMRISDINAMQTLVGSMRKKAVVKNRHYSPLDLNAMIDVHGKKWKLIEATSINDRGQIVGYGTVEGKTRIFLLNPVAPALKFYRK